MPTTLGKRIPTPVLCHVTCSLPRTSGCTDKHRKDGACPTGSFPSAWPDFVQLVRDISPSTVICPGPDCSSKRNLPVYPVWLPCKPSVSMKVQLSCNNDASYDLMGFGPMETSLALFSNRYDQPIASCFWGGLSQIHSFASAMRQQTGGHSLLDTRRSPLS